MGPDKQKKQNTGLFKARWWKEREEGKERREINKKGRTWSYFQDGLPQDPEKDIWASKGWFRDVSGNIKLQ